MLPGSVVAATLTDMGAAMMGDGPGPAGAGMARVLLTPPRVPAGQASLHVTNTGILRHELLVLPLAADQPIGAGSNRPGHYAMGMFAGLDVS